MKKSTKIILILTVSIVLGIGLYIFQHRSYIISTAYFINQLIKYGKGTQQHILEHPKIGQKVNFLQPISYSQRQQAAIVPIVAKIRNELIWIHVKRDSQIVNQYVPNNTDFTITDVYTYKDIINQQRYYYILSDEQKMKYILSEKMFKTLMKPIYQNAQAPVKIFDELYITKKSIKMRFFAIKERNPRLQRGFFDECNVQEFSIKQWEQEATATVNFNQLVCLYGYFWDDFHSERLPMSFEVLQ